LSPRIAAAALAVLAACSSKPLLQVVEISTTVPAEGIEEEREGGGYVVVPPPPVVVIDVSDAASPVPASPGTGTVVLEATAVPGAAIWPIDAFGASFQSGVASTPDAMADGDADAGLGPCQVETTSGAPPSTTSTTASAGTLSLVGASSTLEISPNAGGSGVYSAIGVVDALDAGLGVSPRRRPHAHRVRGHRASVRHRRLGSGSHRRHLAGLR
jgi:hypothetical protein